MASVDAAARPRPLRPRPKRGGATRRWHLPGKCARGRKPLLLARGAQTAELSCARRRRQTMGDENSSEMNRRRPFQLDDVYERERRGERGGKGKKKKAGDIELQSAQTTASSASGLNRALHVRPVAAGCSTIDRILRLAGQLDLANAVDWLLTPAPPSPLPLPIPFPPSPFTDIGLSICW